MACGCAGIHEDAERPVAGLGEGDELAPQRKELVGVRDEDSYPEIGVAVRSGTLVPSALFNGGARVTML